MAAAKLPFYQDPQFFRAQTYLIASVAGLLLLTLFFPLLHYQFAAEGVPARVSVLSNRFDTQGVIPAAVASALQDKTWLLQLFQILTAFGVGASLACLFRYRQLPLLLTNTFIVLVVLLAILMLRIVAVFQFGQAIEAALASPAENAVERSMGLGYYLPIAALLLMGIARSLVQKDQRRLRDAERFY